MISNLELICKHFFEHTELDILDHNLTRHATLEGTKSYYIANFIYEGISITARVDLEDMVNKCTSIKSCNKYLTDVCKNAIFQYQLTNYTLTEGEIKNESID